jgi:hypothetical protein
MHFSKKILFAIGSTLLLIVLIAIAYFRPFASNPFFLLSTNFDPESRLIAYTIPSLDFTFSQDLSETFTARDFSISPFVEGTLKVEKNLLSYQLSQELTKDTVYEITLNTLTTADKKSTLNPLSFTITAIDIPTITKIIPEGAVQNLQQEITVFFSSPMVPLSLLDTMKAECPLEISPALEGECKWISTSIVQFRAKSGFNGATNYTLQVKPTENMLFDIQPFSGSFQTPELAFSVRAENGKLFLETNYPVEEKSLNEKLTLSKNGVQISHTLHAENSERFSITSPDLEYEAIYEITVDEGLYSTEGNLPSQKFTMGQQLVFLDNAVSFVDIFSDTGAYLTTQQIGSVSEYGRTIGHNDTI